MTKQAPVTPTLLNPPPPRKRRIKWTTVGHYALLIILAAIIMGLVTFGFGLLNVPGIVMSIFLGLLLIGTIAIPRLIGRR